MAKFDLEGFLIKVIDGIEKAINEIDKMTPTTTTNKTYIKVDSQGSAERAERGEADTDITAYIKNMQEKARQYSRLTPDEKRALELSASLANVLANVVSDGPNRHNDLVELVQPIHVIQRYILAQPECRANPNVRVLGD
jgi:hypothetical protein